MGKKLSPGEKDDLRKEVQRKMRISEKKIEKLKKTTKEFCILKERINYNNLSIRYEKLKKRPSQDQLQALENDNKTLDRELKDLEIEQEDCSELEDQELKYLGKPGPTDEELLEIEQNLDKDPNEDEEDEIENFMDIDDN